MLDDEFKRLSELDNLRIRARELSDQGMKSLASIENNDPPEGPDATEWEASRWMVETALLVRVQNKREPGEAKKPLVEKLNGISLSEHLFPPDGAEVPVLLAARAMQAFIDFPGVTLSKTPLLCYYRIVREIYTAAPPEWSVGGARAGLGGEASAYVTSECIRAVLMLARSLEKTADFFRATAAFHRKIKHLGSKGIPEVWKEVESERAALEWFISRDLRHSHLAVKLTPAKPDPLVGRFHHSALVDYFPELGEELKRAFKDAHRNFTDAQSEIKKWRDETESEQDQNRSVSAHEIAKKVIKDAVKMAKEASDFCADSSSALRNLDALARLFDGAAQKVVKVLEPAKRYVLSVLDHELTAAASEQPLWDPQELVFACGAYGAITGLGKGDRRHRKRYKDERLVRACKLLVDALSEKGMFARGKPFHSVKSGLRWHTLQFQACRAFAELLKNVEYDVSPALVKRMLFPFEDLLDPVDGSGGGIVGWHMEDPPIPQKRTMWVSAHAVVALDKLARMLDKQINRMVLENFTAKQPEDISPPLTLDNLIYPDHARRLLGDAVQASAEDRGAGEEFEPIGITLQRMRAHIDGVKLPPGYPPLFSAVLHGPPGTGKTTLLEALAKSSKVPLVELSPSDIAVSGEEAIEARARAIFQALSMLTRVVVIFDEFEPVLAKRPDAADKEEEQHQQQHHHHQQQQSGMYKFLTPGMLPKLTRLYGAAKSKKIAYALVTNLKHELDPAAIRKGRFDHHVAIYRADPVSRAGRLMLQCRMHWPDDRELADELPPEATRRFEATVVTSGGMTPDRLAARWLPNPENRGAIPPVVEAIFGDGAWEPISPTGTPAPESRDYRAAEADGKHLYNWEHRLIAEWRANPGNVRSLLEGPPATP
jgi:KaiC/GvpD/RAD55 family RecA-like ATPase